MMSSSLSPRKMFFFVIFKFLGRMWRNGRRESFKSFSFFLMVQVRNLSSVQMDFIFSFYFASATEAWHSVPLISIHLPFIGAIFSLNNWLQAVAIAVLILRGNHSSNHSRALSLNSAFSGFRKSVSLFWNTQTLERVHLKWRREQNRSLSSPFEMEKNIFLDQKRSTNRLSRIFPDRISLFTWKPHSRLLLNGLKKGDAGMSKKFRRITWSFSICSTINGYRKIKVFLQ